MAPGLIKTLVGILSGHRNHRKRSSQSLDADDLHDPESSREAKRRSLSPSQSRLARTSRIRMPRAERSEREVEKKKYEAKPDTQELIFEWRNLPAPRRRRWQSKHENVSSISGTPVDGGMPTPRDAPINGYAIEGYTEETVQRDLLHGFNASLDLFSLRGNGKGLRISALEAVGSGLHHAWEERERTLSKTSARPFEEEGRSEAIPERFSDSFKSTLMARLEAQLSSTIELDSKALFQQSRQRRHEMEQHENLGRVAARRASNLSRADRVKERNEEALWLAKELEACRLERTAEKKEKPKAVVELTAEERKMYEDNIAKDGSSVIVSHSASGIDIKGRDMAKLAPFTWLNDEIVNIYMSLLQQRDVQWRASKGRPKPKCHFFNSYFVSKLYSDSGSYNYDGVRRWTTAKRLKASGQASSSILDCDRVIIPVNRHNTHWMCAVIDIRNQELVQYDSLGGEYEELLVNLARYLTDEFLNKRNEKRTDILQWPRKYPKDIPRQENGCDCGVFTVLFAEYASRAAPLDFSQADINDFRIKILNDIMRLRIN